jgi:hypothetical protein
VTTELIIICFKKNEMGRPPVSSNQVVGVRVVTVEVENEDELSSFVNDNLVFFVLQSDELMWLDHGSEY